MAYELPSLDTSQRQKFGTMLDMLAPVDQYAQQLRGYGDQALERAFAAAQARIGAQFTPAMRMAQSRLGGSPLLADSGYANRLNRQLQGAAFGDLSNAYGDAAAQNAQSQLQGYQQLLNARMGLAGNLLGGVEKKKKTGDKIGGALGSMGGLVGAYLMQGNTPSGGGAG